jgi:DnaD/phage-associated family protein
MSEFKGFPERMQFTPVPNLVFSSLSGRITDIVELKVLLHVFEILYPKRGQVKYICAPELGSHPSLVQDLPGISQETLERTLENLSQKGILFRFDLAGEQGIQPIYFLNNTANRLIVEKIRNSEIAITGFKPAPGLPPAAAPPTDVFTLYEENVGMLTPLIADELKEAAGNYPETWIRDAIKEAVSQNKRNWKYISRILERWSTEGKKDGANRGNLKTNTDPDKYVRGKYGHMVQR